MILLITIYWFGNDKSHVAFSSVVVPYNRYILSEVEAVDAVQNFRDRINGRGRASERTNVDFYGLSVSVAPSLPPSLRLTSQNGRLLFELHACIGGICVVARSLARSGLLP